MVDDSGQSKLFEHEEAINGEDEEAAQGTNPQPVEVRASSGSGVGDETGEEAKQETASEPVKAQAAVAVTPEIPKPAK